VWPEYDGLRVDPCTPPDWTGFMVDRRFRGVLYRIKVTNPQGVSKGVAAIRVDGEVIEGTLLPVFTGGGEHQVDVMMG